MENRHSRSLLPASPDAAGCLQRPNQSVSVAMQSKANFDFFKSLSLLDPKRSVTLAMRDGTSFAIERSCS